MKMDFSLVIVEGDKFYDRPQAKTGTETISKIFLNLFSLRKLCYLEENKL